MHKVSVPEEVPVSFPDTCPFKEFKDAELANELWQPVCPLLPKRESTPAAPAHPKLPSKQVKLGDAAWSDPHEQPLPASLQHRVQGWRRAEELCAELYETDVVVFEETTNTKMAIKDYQQAHRRIFEISEFCRKLLNTCYILEGIENFTVEHQWEGFSFALGPEGWRARCHVYAPGVKAGGGPGHRPGLSKNGCYLIRLFYMGVWRGVLVDDAVPVDDGDAPLLPFAPLCPRGADAIVAVKKGERAAPAAPLVQLWPVLLCKAVLKLLAPMRTTDMTTDAEMTEFDFIHVLTGTLTVTLKFDDPTEYWERLEAEVAQFQWDDDDDAGVSTARTARTKKTVKETAPAKKSAIVTITLKESKNKQPFDIPGVTPAYELDLGLKMMRSIPIKKPLPEPEVTPWKVFRWVHWARSHGMYEEYDFPTTKFMKTYSLLQLSYAPHLLDACSTLSVTYDFRAKEANPDNEKSEARKKEEGKKGKDEMTEIERFKQENREWALFSSIHELTKRTNIYFFPSMFCVASAGSSPPVHITKLPPNRSWLLPAPKRMPLYLQVDCPVDFQLRVMMNVIHPRVYNNCGILVSEYVDKSSLFLEQFEWFVDKEQVDQKGFLYCLSMNYFEVNFDAGRHFCRFWVKSSTNWTIMLLSEAQIKIGPRDYIMSSASQECPWAIKQAMQIGQSFVNWIKAPVPNNMMQDREFYSSFRPDARWDSHVIGYDKHFVHWMFRRSLQIVLKLKLSHDDFVSVSSFLRKMFRDPDFGMSDKPYCLPKPEIGACDCSEEDSLSQINESPPKTQQEETKAEEISLWKDIRIINSARNYEPVCDLATEDEPCFKLKKTRSNIIHIYEAALMIQKNWRGTRTRKYLNSHTNATPDVIKLLSDAVFTNADGLTFLFRTFTSMFPGTDKAYSFIPGLRDIFHVTQYSGSVPIPAAIDTDWYPFFNVTFYCHDSVCVHFDLVSGMHNQTFEVYDKGTREKVLQVFNTHMTFAFHPNSGGYAVLGYGLLTAPVNHSFDCHWTLSVMSSKPEAFHSCDNFEDGCSLVPVQSVMKYFHEEMFRPNKQNFLSGVVMRVNEKEIVSLRVTASSPDLEIVAILCKTKSTGEVEEIDRCEGIGHIFWPYIELDVEIKIPKGLSRSAVDLKSTTKPDKGDTREYFIQVLAPYGWPLTVDQWKAVLKTHTYRNRKKDPSLQRLGKAKAQTPPHKEGKPSGQTASGPDLDAGDPRVAVEMAVPGGGVVTVKRNDVRDHTLAVEVKSWEVSDPGRAARCALLRQSFLDNYLLPDDFEERRPVVEEEMLTEFSEKSSTASLRSEGGSIKEEQKYLTMPEQLKARFKPLEFLKDTYLEKIDQSTVQTPTECEQAKLLWAEKIDAAVERMESFQRFNEVHILGRQKRRVQIVEKLFVDAQYNDAIIEAYEAKTAAIQRLLAAEAANKLKKTASKENVAKPSAKAARKK